MITKGKQNTYNVLDNTQRSVSFIALYFTIKVRKRIRNYDKILSLHFYIIIIKINKKINFLNDTTLNFTLAIIQKIRIIRIFIIIQL